MSNPTLGFDPLVEGYSAVYQSLSELRESFHRSGRLDDSNAKLDEVAKLFATYLAFKRGLIPSFPDRSDPNLVDQLRLAFTLAARLPQYMISGDYSIFGTQPTLVLRDGDEDLAADLVALVRQAIDLAFNLRAEGRPFDILNEAFGHFVRDNFRGNVEDAQYMTPPEVVDFMAEMALREVENGQLGDGTDNPLTVLDPSCGVGSFLAAFYHRVKNSGRFSTDRLRLFGQDKVERMARLATINLELFDVREHRITVGNSLARGSHLDHLNGQVDIILTNPPFGARFSGDDIRRTCGENTPFFSSLRKAASSVDSELLFVDRNLQLLREGGRLLIVIPDGVVSAKGTAALLRQHVAGAATVRAVVELPAVTFAQAGTRTKTSVLYIQKGRSETSSRVFMAVAGDLGFQVSSRKGVQIKQAAGENQLPQILEGFVQRSSSATSPEGAEVLRREPSCVVVDESDVLRGSWTPNHYSASRVDAISLMRRAVEFEMVPLRDLVEFCADTRKCEPWRPGMAFLSVLHVLGEGLVDMAAALNYGPKTPGVPIYEDEILISRINPRIPRVCVTPRFAGEALCSSEFEVMKVRDGRDPFVVAYLLLAEGVQSQIRSLTSGTSASHNRIRTSDLASVLVPIARSGTEKAAKLATLASSYRDALTALADSASKIAALRAEESSLLLADGD